MKSFIIRWRDEIATDTRLTITAQTVRDALKEFREDFPNLQPTEVVLPSGATHKVTE